MLLSIGRRQHEPDLVDLLSECHDRIRRFLDLAHRLTTTAGLADDDVRTAAGQIHRYFTTAFPLHMADEEEAILPYLRGRDGTLEVALARMKADHTDHADLVQRLVAECDQLTHQPRQLAARARAFAEVTDELTLTLEAHLALEELVIFPAIAALPMVDRAAVRAEMRARRGG